MGERLEAIEPNFDGPSLPVAPNNYVAIVDLKTLEVTGHIDVGGEPDGLAWAPALTAASERSNPRWYEHR